MLLISFERLATLNYQPDFAKALRFVNERVLAGDEVYQFVGEIRLETGRFPEGHIYPRGTVLLDDKARRETLVPDGIRCDFVTEDLDAAGHADIRRLRLPKRIAVYNGLNCWPYFFDPYKNLLDLFGVPFTEAGDQELRDGLLDDCDMLIVPGGPDAGESYYAGLGDKGIDNIKRFIREGGNYIGSCAGAFFPLKTDKSLPESRMLLDIVPVKPLNGMDFTQSGTALIRLELAPEGPGALYSLSYGSYRSIDVIFWEGPVFACDEDSQEDGSVRILATYQMLLTTAAAGGRWKPKNPIAADALEYGNQVNERIFEEQMRGMLAALEADYGRGRLHLYAFHPEFGAPTADSWETGLPLLFVMNSIFDLASRGAGPEGIAGR